MKVWVLVDSHNGYFSQFNVYTGKKGNTTENNLGTRVVKTLTAELKGKDHHVFFDNCFTNERLLQDLLADDIYSCGTARKDRKGIPPAMKQGKLPNRYGHIFLKYCSGHLIQNTQVQIHCWLSLVINSNLFLLILYTMYPACS